MASSAKYRQVKRRRATLNQIQISRSKRLFYKLFLIFCIFFIVSFLGGIIRGYYVTKQSDYFIPFIKSNISLMTDNENRYYIGYICHGTFYRYYIDDNHVERSFDEDIQEEMNRRSLIDSLVGEGTVLKVLLGGAVAYSFKDVLSFIIGEDSSDLTTKERISVVTVGLVSAVSGYALGYWSMVASMPKCNSLGILTLLDKPVEWNRFEREVWQRSKSKASLELSSALRRIKINRPDIMDLEDLNDPLLHQIRQKINDIEKRTADTQYDFRTEDFKSLEEIHILTKILLQNYGVDR